MPIRVIAHPLASHLLARLRDRETQPEVFRRSAKALSTLLLLEATKELRTVASRVMTPISETDASVLDDQMALVPVLRAGLAMIDPALELFPDVAVGYIGLERSETDARAHSYYCKLPDLQGRTAICLDPMLATGGSACQALSMIQAKKPTRTHFVCVVAAPEGIQAVRDMHPQVTIVTAAIDRGLDAQKFIVPGLGDFGDRLFGTS